MEKWSFKKPTKQGVYLCSAGDVVSEYSLFLTKFIENDSGDLVDISDMTRVKDWGKHVKFMKIDIQELNQLGNEQ